MAEPAIPYRLWPEPVAAAPLMVPCTSTPLVDVGLEPKSDEAPAPDTELEDQVAELYALASRIGETRLVIHTGAAGALATGAASVLFSAALARAFQRVLRLVEWGASSNQGARCPACGMHRIATARVEAGPNRGHSEECPLRKNLDNINRALGIANRGRSQGPGQALVWAQRQPVGDQVDPNVYPSPLSPEAIASTAMDVLRQSQHVTIDGDRMALSPIQLSELLRDYARGALNGDGVGRALAREIADSPLDDGTLEIPEDLQAGASEEQDDSPAS